MQTMIAMLAAARLGISTRTLGRWADRGRIRSGRTAAGWRTYDPGDVERLKRRLAHGRR
jgi:DNA-binding transcriptional MerR regulator